MKNVIEELIKTQLSESYNSIPYSYCMIHDMANSYSDLPQY